MKKWDSDLLAQIEVLEKHQLRALCDLMVDPNDSEARQYFDDRRAQIAELRSQLSANRASLPKDL